MPLNLKEAETAAYLDPSQENLAVYVKLLEEALVGVDDQSAEIKRLEMELDCAISPDGMASVEEKCDTLASELEALRSEAQYVVDMWETSELAEAIRCLDAVLRG